MIMNRFLQRLPRLSYRAKVAMLLVCGVVVGLGGLFLYLLRFHTYLGDDPSACVNCHIMTPYYATWMHGAHARNTTCNDCHVPHDNVFRKYFFKGKDGMNHVYKFVTRQERQAIQAIDESAEVIMETACAATPPSIPSLSTRGVSPTWTPSATKGKPAGIATATWPTAG